MKKFKKKILYLFGLYLSFALRPFANGALMYGMPEYVPEPTISEKILSVVFSPIFIVSTFAIIALAFLLGTIIFIKRKRKNVKKDS